MIESLLIQQLKSNSDICGSLTTYGGGPAIFYQESPKDTDPNWDGSCFPRLDFVIDRRSDSERNTSGSLSLSVWVSSKDLSPTGGNLEREIELKLIDLISGTFYSPEGKDAIGIEWVHSSAFVKTKDSEIDAVDVFGVELRFDLISFTAQETTDPDPVQGANAFIKEHYPDMVVIGEDELPPIWKPSDDNPALYWRFRGYEGGVRQTYSVNWYLANLALHVFTDSIHTRNTWLKAAAELMNMKGEIILLDYSPMFIQKLRIFHEGHPLHEGQLVLQGEFGVLVSQRKETAQFPLNRVITKKGALSCQNK